MNALTVLVAGTPITQGSKTRNRYGMHDDNAKALKPWRTKVKKHAIEAARYHDPFTGPVRVTIRFCFNRPKSHYRTGRNAHLLKDGAPLYPVHKNDVDKLQRACFDALTDAAVWADDGQVVDVRARKFYAGESEYALDHPGVLILIEPLDASPAVPVPPVPAAGEAPTPQEVLFP